MIELWCDEAILKSLRFKQGHYALLKQRMFLYNLLFAPITSFCFNRSESENCYLQQHTRLGSSQPVEVPTIRYFHTQKNLKYVYECTLISILNFIINKVPTSNNILIVNNNQNQLSMDEFCLLFLENLIARC